MSSHLTEMLPALALCFLELSFLAVLIITMHSLRKVIGLTSYYMVVSFILVFAQLINAADISLVYEFLDIQMNISSSLLLTTFMASLLITYTLDGPIAAQRLTVAAGQLNAAGTVVDIPSNATAGQAGRVVIRLRDENGNQAACMNGTQTCSAEESCVSLVSDAVECPGVEHSVSAWAVAEGSAQDALDLD